MACRFPRPGGDWEDPRAWRCSRLTSDKISAQQLHRLEKVLLPTKACAALTDQLRRLAAYITRGADSAERGKGRGGARLDTTQAPDSILTTVEVHSNSYILAKLLINFSRDEMVVQPTALIIAVMDGVWHVQSPRPLSSVSLNMIRC